MVQKEFDTVPRVCLADPVCGRGTSSPKCATEESWFDS